MSLDRAKEAAAQIIAKYHHDLPEEMQNLQFDILNDVGGSPWLFAILIGKLMALADPGELEVLRKLPLKKWIPKVSDYVEDIIANPVPDSGYIPPISKPAPPPSAPIPKPQIKPPRNVLTAPTRVSVTLDEETAVDGEIMPSTVPPAEELKPGVSDEPPLPPTPPLPPSGAGGDEPPDEPDVPSWLTEMEADAYRQARDRAGEFARGLGNYVDESTGKLVTEIWQGEVIERFADEEKREENLRLLKEKTAEAIAHGWTADELARRLARATKDWGRRWDRIAETELQGAYNDGVFIEAIKYEGENARFARVPDAAACDDCIRLFLNSDGTPKIFTAEELVNNGTNVGKKRRNWLATLWPVHPRCRCDVQPIPPGFKMNKDMELV